MDLLELALNPRKAAQRMSPFRTSMSDGAARKLEYYFGDRATNDPAERVLYSRDAATPPGTLNLLLKRGAWAVVRPKVRGELLELIDFANTNGIPIVPRGSGTSGYGGAVPTEGGVVVDMRGFNKVLKLDKDAKTVLVEANATFGQLEETLRANGLALRQYPTSMHHATIAGWLSQGGGGVGSLKYGPFVRDVVGVLLMTPDGQLRKLNERDLELVDGSFGTAGFIIEVTLRVREAKTEKSWLATFETREQMTLAARRLALESGAWSLSCFTTEYAELVNEAAGSRILPTKPALLVTFESADDKGAAEMVKGVVESSGGSLAADKDAQKAWDNRFNHLNLKRLGPSVVVAEAAIQTDKLAEGMDAAWAAHKMEVACMWAIAIAPREFDIIFYGLEDERRGLTYPLAMGNALAVIDAVKRKGGRSYSTGVLASNESEHVLTGGSRNLLQRAVELKRGAAITIGAIVGALLVWAPMALLSNLLADRFAPTSIVGGVLGFWQAITQPLGGGWFFALVQGTFIGTVVGLVVFGGLVVTLFQRGERFWNTFLAIAIGPAVFALLHIVGLFGPLGPILAIGLGLVAGGLGVVWVLPLIVAAWVFLGKHEGRLGRLQAHRKKTDPKEIFNPGPVLGARSRIMPLPVHDFPLQLRMASPLLKSQRGLFEYAGDPQWSAVQRALGRVHAGGLAELSTEITTCIFCGMCNAAAPESKSAPWESAMPRGRVQLAKAVIEGKARLSPRAQRNVAWTALEYGPDAICPTRIPIQRVTDLLLAAGVQANGALPEHAALADSFAANGNALGKPKDGRGKWVNLGFDPVSETVFLADDVAAYDAPELAQSAALALVNAGHGIGHMGKADAGSAAVLFETGQREAAELAVVPFLEALQKRGVKTIVTPDANAARAILLDWPLIAKANELDCPDVLHTSTVLAELVKAKKVEIEDGKTLQKTVVVHAPEALTREQRAAVLEVAKATGAKVLDAPHAECGHGRALDKLDGALAQRIAEDCLKSAIAAGAQAILTMSPGCTTTLRSAAKKAKAGIEVLDLHVVLAQAMKSSGGASAAVAVVEEKPAVAVEPVIGPDQYRVEFVKEGVVLAVGKNQTILDAGEAQGIELPSSCKAGSCDTCSAKWEGTAADQSAGAALTADQQKSFVLTCIAKPRGPIRIWSDERPK